MKTLLNKVYALGAMSYLLWAMSPCFAYADATPQLPRIWLNTTLPVQTGATWTVAADCSDLQTKIDGAALGDTLQIPSGAVCLGNYVLKYKPTGSGWIVIRTAAPDSQLPAPGQRINPTYNPVMPKIVSPNSDPAIFADFQAHHYRLIGLEITVTTNPLPIVNYGIVVLGSGAPDATSPALVAHDLVVDRCYIHGSPTLELRRGIVLHGASNAVIDSYISEAHQSGFDSQAIEGWNGPGPYKIVNNFLEGAAENIMFGGAPSIIPGLIASDIEIRHNHFYKPWTWKVSVGTNPPVAVCRPGENFQLQDNGGTTLNWYLCTSGGWAPTGTPVPHFTVKNLFELKNAQRVLFDGNVLENNWVDGQTGSGILFNGIDGPTSTIQDVTVTHNILRHSYKAVNISANIYSPQLIPTNNLRFENNLFDDIQENLITIQNGVSNFTFNHNTGLNSGSTLITDLAPGNQLVFKNNIAGHGLYGVFGSGVGEGLPALNTYFPGYVFQKNVLASAGDLSAGYPPTTSFAASWADIRFVNLNGGADGDYHLAASSPYKNAGTDGKDLGADIDTILAATQGVTDGSPGPIFVPPQPPSPPNNPTTTVMPGALNPQVYPNPWRKDKHTGGITFNQVVVGGTIKIFTVSGHQVKEIPVSATTIPWNLTNDKGDKVASGIYVYVVTDGQGNKAKGKVALIK